MRNPATGKNDLTDLNIVDGETPFAPGDMLRGSFRVDGEQAGDLKSAELSVVWYTAGKGEEDFGVHYFERYTTEGPDAVDLARRREFRTLLPGKPLSYDGVIVKVCWCVRLRLFFPRGREHVAEAAFQLGSVAAAVPVSDEE